MSLKHDFVPRKTEMELGFDLVRDGATTWLADVYLDGARIFQNLYCIGANEEEAIKELMARMTIKPNS